MRSAYSGVRFSGSAAAAGVTLVLVAGCLGVLSPHGALSAFPVSSVASVERYAVRTSVAKVRGKSYLTVRVTSAYGVARGFEVRQRVCGGGTCRTAAVTLVVEAGRTAWRGKYLGTGAYHKDGAPAVSVTVPPPAPPVPTATVTVTVSPAATPIETAVATATETPLGAPVDVPTPAASFTGPADDILCGAPSGPHRFTYCDTGIRVHQPADDACQVFSCIAHFSDGQGHLVMCADGKVSMSGGRPGVCSSHDGWIHDIYRKIE